MPQFRRSLPLPAAVPAHSRQEMLRCVSALAHADPQRWVYTSRVRRELGLDAAGAYAAIASLAAEGLVRQRLGFLLSITPAGIAAANPADSLSPHSPVSGTWPEPALAPGEIVQPSVPAHPAQAIEFPPAVSASLSHTLLGIAGNSLEDAVSPAMPLEALPGSAAAHSDIATDAEADLELRMLCEAIGLDPRELDAGALAAPAPSSASSIAEPAKTLSQDTGPVTQTLSTLMLEVPKLELTPDDKAEAEAEIATSMAQLLSPRPKPAIIAISLTALLAVLDAAGSRLPVSMQVSLTEIRLFLTQMEAQDQSRTVS